MNELGSITVDVRKFAQVSCIDTCAVWNLLSSRKLTIAAAQRNLHFILVDYVRYEALVRPRTNPSETDKGLQEILRLKIEQGRDFSTMALTIDDLREVARLHSIRRLGRGEIAAITLARKLRQGFTSDDQRARRLAKEVVGDLPVQTTPHLLGWLVFHGDFGDGDVPAVIAEHESNVIKGRLTPYFWLIYKEAMRCRMMEASSRVGRTDAS